LGGDSRAARQQLARFCHQENQENVNAMDGLERKVITDAVSSVYKTGQSFVNYLEQKLSIIKQNKGGSSNA